MKKTRTGAFETNSSSTHTIIIPRKQERCPMNIDVTLNEYGWEYETHRDLLNYIYTAICCIYKDDYKKYTDKIDKMVRPYNIHITWQKPEFDYSYDEKHNIRYCWLENGSIDHSNELEDFLDEVLNNEDLLIDAILGGYVNTGNDNDICSQGWDDDRETTDDCYYYYKGN